MAQSKTTRNVTPETQSPVKLPKVKLEGFRIWLIGDTPLITHAWSEKARRAMLSKQSKETREGTDIRDPQEDFLNSLYEFSPGVFGFPAMAVKKALLSVAHKDKGVPRETVKQALWLHAEMVRTRPALAGAVCDMPLLRIHGSAPEMREDMVRVGSGMNKTATLAYRAQFKVWALRIRGRLNTSLCPIDWVPFLGLHSGMSTGLGDWRNEKNGMFGAFHVASDEEVTEWEAFAAGKGKMPQPPPFGDGDEWDEAAQ